MKFYTMKLQELSEESTDPVYIMPFQQSDVELHDHNFLSLPISLEGVHGKIWREKRSG